MSRYWESWAWKFTVLVLFTLILIQTKWNTLQHDVEIQRPDTQENVNLHIKRSDTQENVNLQLRRSNTHANVDFRVIVLTFNRHSSLKRLLDSLNEVDYLKEKVVIEIWIDRSKEGHIDSLAYHVAKDFDFKMGRSVVFNHTRHVGIYGQWIGTWQPKEETREIALILEDDITVSPFIYKYLKLVHARYDSIERVNGYSLQCNMKLGGEPGNVHAPDSNIVFAFPIIGTWGFSPKKMNWIRFTNWYKKFSTMKNFQPLVPNILPSQWYKQFIQTGKTDTMWEMWHIYNAWKNKEVTIFPNLPECRGLTKNWREAGLHPQSKGNDQLISHWDERFDNLPKHPNLLDSNGHVQGYI